MDTERTTLSEFVDDVDGVDQNAPDGHGSPTPEENAADIQELIGLVQSLTDQLTYVSESVGELEERDTNGGSIDAESTACNRMFH